MSESQPLQSPPRPHAASVRRRIKPRADLAWGLVSFVGVTAALVSGLELMPALRDPEFGLRLEGMRRQLAENRGRPLVTVLGSSRVSMGLRPDALAERPGGERAPIVFNQSLVGSGPVMQLMCLDRLLHQGIRPDLVVVEYWPPLFQQGPLTGEETRIDVNRLDHRDVRLLSRVSGCAPALLATWLESQLLPFWSHRFILLSQYAPSWLPFSAREDSKWNGLDRLGWLPYRASVTRAQHEDYVRKARAYYGPLLNSACVSEKADRALRGLLGRLRSEGIPAVMLYMPESSEIRSLYDPTIQKEISAYLARVNRDLGVPTIDARRWLSDDNFLDGFHLLPRGARAFTLRFGREVAGALLQNKES